MVQPEKFIDREIGMDTDMEMEIDKERERERREEREKVLLERTGLYNYRIWQGQMIKKDRYEEVRTLQIWSLYIEGKPKPCFKGLTQDNIPFD